MALISWEDGQVIIDGQPLPGLLVDQSVDCRVRFDEQEIDGQSGKKRTPMGWEDTEVCLCLVLTTDNPGQDCYEKLQTINAIFRGHDSSANPKIYTVDNRHLLARGGGQLIFSGLSSLETEDDDTIEAGLSFIENNPPVVKTETQVAQSAFQKARGQKEKKEAQQKVVVPDIMPADPNAQAPGVEVVLE